MPDEPLSAAVVIQRANRLRDSRAMQNYRQNIEFVRAAITTKLPADIPGHVGQGTVYEMNSPEAMSLRKSLRSKIRGYSTFVTITAFNLEGSVTNPMHDKEDKLERWDTLLLDTLDDGGTQTNLITDHQLGDPYAVVRLRKLGAVEAEERGCKWAMEVIDPLIAQFPEVIGGTYRPKRFAMRYTMLVAEAMERYSALEGPFATKKLRWSDSKFELIGLEDPRPLWGDSAGRNFPGGNPPDMDTRECEFVEYEDGKYIYHVIKAAGTGQAMDGTGEVVWYEKCTTNGVQAVIVPGDINTAGAPGERMVPFLMAYIIWLVQLDAILALRASLAMRDRPDVFVNVEPDRFEALKMSGGVIPATPEQIAAKGPGIIAVNGEPTMWAAAPNPDLNELAVYIAGRLDREAARYQTITDPSVVQQATAEAFYTASSASDTEQTPLLVDRAKAIAMILDMVHADILNSDKETPADRMEPYGLYAGRKLPRARGGEIGQGEAVAITAADLDFGKGGYKVNVATKQETESQRERRSNQMALQVQQKVSTPYEHVASLYTDATAQLQEIAKWDGYAAAGAVRQSWPMALVLERARLSGGSRIIIDPSKMPVTAPQPAAQTPGPTYRPTPTPGASGGAGQFSGATG